MGFKDRKLLVKPDFLRVPGDPSTAFPVFAILLRPPLFVPDLTGSLDLWLFRPMCDGHNRVSAAVFSNGAAV